MDRRDAPGARHYPVSNCAGVMQIANADLAGVFEMGGSTFANKARNPEPLRV
ncbi:MAG: hypothetical protein NTX56_11850 [Proteobacteria bacterium]|nr:hypothetical protein [Pseudomonadota bacterium]